MIDSLVSRNQLGGKNCCFFLQYYVNITVILKVYPNPFSKIFSKMKKKKKSSNIIYYIEQPNLQVIKFWYSRPSYVSHDQELGSGFHFTLPAWSKNTFFKLRATSFLFKLPVKNNKSQPQAELTLMTTLLHHLGCFLRHVEAGPEQQRTLFSCFSQTE